MKKPRILIADDDTMVRIGLKTVINWEENGFTLVGEAQDGKQALRLAESQHPDIIITDVKMPGMDGIELIKQLRIQGNTAKILVLSSYDEFDLVKQALKLGATDYLLKLNLEPEELLRCLRSAIAKQDDTPAVSADDMQNRTVLQQCLLRDVVSNFYLNEEQLKCSMNELDIHLDARPIYCMILKVGELYRFEDTSAEELQMLQFSVIHITEEIVNDLFCGYCFCGKTGEFNILLSGGGSDHLALVSKLAYRLRRMLMEYLNLSCTVLVGSSQKPGGAGIQQAFRQANAVLTHRFYLDHDGVLFWNGDMEKAQQDSYSLSGIRMDLSDILISGRSEELKRILDRLMEDIRRLRLSRSAVCSIALELFYIVQEYFEKNDLSAEVLLPHSFRTYEQLLHMETLRDVTQWLHALQEDLAVFMRREGEKGYPKVIGTVQDWVAAHYHESVSLQDAARAANLRNH